MDQNPCKRCGKTVTDDENHPCFRHKKFDYRNSLQRPVESDKHHDEVKDKSMENSNDNTRCLSGDAGQNKNKKSEFMNLSLFQNNEIANSVSSKDNSCTTFSENFINEQLTNSCDSSYYDPISDVQMTEVQTNENESVTTFAENYESRYRLENDQSETFEKTIVVTGSSGVDIQKQEVLGASDLIYATTDEECKMSLEGSKWQTLKKDKNYFMDALEYVIINALSDNNNISGSANSTVNPDLPPGSNESKNGKRKLAENVNDENISLQMNYQSHNKNEKMSTDEKEPISAKKEDDAVAGPSGFCPRKKKFPETFSRKDTLETHYRTGTGDKPFMCNVCKKKFSWKSHLDQHYLTHTGERPFVCDFCEKGFTRKGDLNIHVMTHTGERPFVCDFCEKGFTRKCDLNIHVMTHTGDKPFVCDVCNKAFARKSTLKTHARTHTGERPYKCPICGVAFSSSSDCNRHRRRMH
ncbi:zinc finger protein 112-like [Argiope bruennichi]|uniref:zinc finger protein 112-like n=1 Tax=Argiope bruennichi TaxID=94029 RepID=UPI0024948B06|nr:zinc finger protein 112-like [Argiope bruennichi]